MLIGTPAVYYTPGYENKLKEANKVSSATPNNVSNSNVTANKVSRTEYQRRLMRKRRNSKPKSCPHCGGEL